MGRNELFYKLALSRVDGVGPVKYKRLLEQMESAEEIFSMSFRQLKARSGLSESNCYAIKHFSDYHSIEKELEYTQRHHIQILDITHKDYPQRLRQCIDSPSVLFFKGNGDLNQTRIVSVIGTRSYTEYGKRMCEELIEGLKNYQVMVSSGLAFGIDAIAHKACVRQQVSTVGVVAHGLNTMYPAAHRSLANDMMQHGGILSEYFSDARIDKGNFPSRNRIVAGMSDATIIVETDIRGGSMITAEIAYSYNRDVCCFPGRASDTKSHGCNHLIKTLKAQMITNADDVANCLGWTRPKPQAATQRQLFVELTEHEQVIVELLRTNPTMHIDEFYSNSQLNSTQLASSLLGLEMQNIVRIHPGKMVSLVD